MDGTIIGQGFFNANSVGLANPNPGVASESNANATVIAVPSGADWVSVYNFTASGKVGSNAAYFNGVADSFIGKYFYWQRGMPIGQGIVDYKANGSNAISEEVLVSGAFTLYDPSGQDPLAQPLLGPAIATTASSNATQPVVLTANTAGLSVGSIVRLSNGVGGVAQNDVYGVDMVISAINPGVSFTLLFAANALATAPGIAGTAGFYRVVNYPFALFYPKRRVVTNISQAVNALVSVSSPHGLTAGQAIRFNLPLASGMVQLNSTPLNNYMVATVVQVIDDYDFTINVDTTAFTAFTYPTSAQMVNNSLPMYEPVGENTAASLSSVFAQTPVYQGQQIFNTNTGLLADSVVNTGFLGMILGIGGNGNNIGTPIIGPAGSISWSVGNVPTGDLMFWRAGKSTYGGL